MDLTNEDVTDILALLDSLPYDELDLQTARFRLTLRRTPDGWTQAAETRSAPNALPAAPGAVSDAADVAVAAGAPVAAGAAGAASGSGARGPQAPSSGAGGPQAPTGVDGAEVDGADEVDGELVAVRAPLPGTFYRAPRPGAASFVEVGSRVGADTVVGIVETMKLFNSVAAGAAGTVAEICLANAEFADRGATLLRIRAD